MSDNESDNEQMQLRHQRGIIKGKLTKFEKFLKDETNKNKSKQIETRLKVIENDLLQFDSCQARLEYLDLNESIEREEIETKFYDLIGEANEIIATVDNVSNNSSFTRNEAPQLQTFSAQLPRLPDMGLPTFCGTYETWLSFFDIYNSVVHSRVDLSDIQKFLYLKTCCRDDALRMISSLEVTTENYSIALDLLKKRYENKRAIINHHVNGLLFNLPEVTKESHIALRKLIDEVYQHKNALLKLNLPADQWDTLLIPLILRKLDERTRREWENKQDDYENLPTLHKLIEYLTKKCFALESNYHENISQNGHSKGSNKLISKNPRDFKSSFKTPQVYQSYASTETIPTCQMCHGVHLIYQCQKFLNLAISEKYDKLRLYKLCTNCLRSGHFKSNCKSSSCKRCGNRHNTILHVDNQKTRTQSGGVSSQLSQNGNRAEFELGGAGVSAKGTLNRSGQRNEINTLQSHNSDNLLELPQSTDLQNLHTNISETSAIKINKNEVFLSIATVLVEDAVGNLHECHALLDSGSQSNIITQSLCDKLNLKCNNIQVSIGGINQNITNITHRTSTKIKSRFDNFEICLAFLVMPTISNNLPLHEFPRDIIKYPQNIHLADKEFNKPKRIDLLIGASIFYELLGCNKISLGRNMPVLFETKFGWIFTGSLNTNHLMTNKQQTFICNLSYENPEVLLNKTLTKFWEVEELPKKKYLSTEDKYCENYFMETTSRDSENRFVVRLPFKENTSSLLGESHTNCLKRFNSLEYRLSRDISLKGQYIEFLREYENLKHMVKVDTSYSISSCNTSYFLPHHPVLKPSSTTTKVRVVFDASARTYTGYSLNDTLLSGPSVQDELFAIILRWRLRNVILNADIKMMFRQILVHPQDRCFQQILWREHAQEPINIYELSTVTYGTTCAPFLVSEAAGN